MNDIVLLVSVAVVAGCAGALVVLTLAARLLYARRRRATERLEPACRAQVEELVLAGEPPHPHTPAERRLLLRLLLRQLDLLRGSEADGITRYLEEAGFVDELADRLAHGHAWQRAAAADELGRTHSRRAVPLLADALSDDSDDVRIVAARSLALIGDPAAVDSLAHALVAPTRWALALMADNLVLLGGGALPTLLAMADRDDARVVVTAVRIVGEIRDTRAVPTLVGLLERSASVDVRAQAACALGKIGGPEATDALLPAVGDRAWEVRAQAAKAVGRLGGHAAATALERAMPDPNWWVRVNCGEALTQLGDEGLAALQRLAGGPDRYAAEQAAAALERVLPQRSADRDATMRRQPIPAAPVARLALPTTGAAQPAASGGGGAQSAVATARMDLP